MLIQHQTNLKLHLTETKYGKMIVPTDDPTIGRSLDLYGEYCDQEIKVLQTLLQPGDWFIDIGANIGTHTIAMHNMCERVLAFEPDIENFTILGRNVAGLCSFKNNVTVSQLALGNEAKNVDTNFDYGKTSIVEGNTVKMAPYDILGIPKTNVVKIDVEGRELDVLVGMRNTLVNQKPDLLIEMQDTSTYSDTFEFLRSVGYNMYWLPVNTFNSNNHKGNKQDIFGDQHGVINWVCSTEELNTNLIPVVDKDDTVERMIWRKRKAEENVGND